MKKAIYLVMACIIGWTAQAADQVIQAETMTVAGPWASTISTPFSGVALYANNDNVTATGNFNSVPGNYTFEVLGASSSEGADAGVTLKVGGVQIATFNFTSTTPVTKSVSVGLSSGGTSQTVELILETDNGSSDTFIDWVGWTYSGAPAPPRPAPSLPATGSFYSDQYRNMFVESGLTSSQVSARYDEMWNQYFVNGNTSNERLFYEVGSDMAYILDTGNDDIRSEGMSYGMMICVQRGDRTRFDKLWKFAKTYSQHAPGTDREGLFSWQLNRSNYSMMDANSAPDGEEYFVMALMFADARWGSQTSGSFNSVQDVFDYNGQANYILDQLLNKPAPSTSSCPTALIDQVERQVVFGICGNSASFTDPSYHLAGFYDYWAQYADSHTQLWSDMAATSRTYLLPNAAHPVTGLMPDYSEFNGEPVNQGNHGNFEYDAWRNIMNISFDYAWFQKEGSSLLPLINRQIDFFKDKPGYNSLWTLDGSYSRVQSHSPGLVACNAVASLALADAKVWPFVDELFTTAIPSGQYRYYDGLLYMMSFMHVAGEFKVWKPGGVVTPPCTPPSASFTKNNESVAGASDGSITFTFSDDAGRTNLEFSLDNGNTYPFNTTDNSGNYTVNNLAPGNYNLYTRWGNDECPVSLGQATIAAGNPPTSGQNAFATHVLPGVIEAENYDLGGSGIAFNDSGSGNNGNSYRSDDVDVEAASDTGGGYNVGWIANGEWLEYTTTSIQAGTYDITLRVASNNNGGSKSILLKLNGTTIGSSVVNYTGGWQNYEDLTISGVSLSASTGAVLRAEFVGGNFNVNKMTFEISGGSNPPTGGGSLIQAEDNNANYYNLNNNGGVIDNISYSHWMRFDNVDISGGTFTYRYSKGNSDNGYMKVRVDNNNDASNIATIYPASTGNWSTFAEETLNISGSGTHTVYLYFHNAYQNIQLDWVQFGQSGARVVENSPLLDEQSSAISVFPNPSSGVVQIRTDGFGDDFKLKLFDLSGKSQPLKVIDRTNERITLSVSKGIYLIHIQTGSEVFKEKLIVN